MCHFVLSAGSNSKKAFHCETYLKNSIFFSITRAWKWILLFTDLQIRENFGQFLHGNWNNKLRREKRLEKYIVLNFSGQLTLNEPVLKWMQPINLSRDTFYCCMCSPAANTEACLWSLLLSVGHSSRVEPSKEVIFKVEERIIHIKGHLLSNLKWFTAVCGAARITSP